ncbi:NAD(P)-binding protein [Iamia sp. SCSIO 61187]|uniref:NAD(P)-binding protein n=1 Tax=Iamia sp. SCSIO 61187 TaxID=2722752 RepID=UPI001C6380C5|nr:NAD(P)-binding protein [Iamia sp. SCSIO 61187]QYG91399.1 NAD(P)-binding protein [Iamia sp. SCSIO 61187]
MTGRTEITVVGGGLAGLIAAVEAAEAGAPVRLLEARRRLGGRATSTPGPFVANLGPHALYAGTELWDWLRRRDLQGRAVTPRSPHMVLRWEGRIRRLPPRALAPVLRLRRTAAPVDVDLRTWLTDRSGPDTAAAVAGLAGALTFDHDPGRLSAAFVVERLQRIFLRPTVAARYVDGGWSALVGRLGAHARTLGVRIELDAGVDAAGLDELRAAGPVILAVEPGAARRLLGDDVGGDGRRVALLDVGLARARDPYVVIDLDEAIFSTRPSAVLPGLAPDGADVVQLSGGMAPDETLDDAEARLEAVLDAASPGWRGRVEWRRQAAVREATGAVDLPGATWRDRPAIDRGDGLWLAGDWVAAPGHLAEVGCTSAVTAAGAAVAARGAAVVASF